jgi:hypothetical protein
MPKEQSFNLPGQSDFTDGEWRLICRLRTPQAVQNYLRMLPYNFEQEKKTCRSFRGVVRENMAHCLEGALVAATILEQHGYPPLLMSFESQDKLDHVLFIFRSGDLWGAVARSRDPGLHGRKPAYRSVRALAYSYVDAYIDATGRITGYGVADLRALGKYNWRLSERNIWKVENYLIALPHRILRSSEARYRRFFLRYLEFKKLHPEKRPEYYSNRHLWL